MNPAGLVRQTVALCKATIALFAAGSAMAGYAAGADRLDGGFFSAGLGVFILACGACALNEFEDRRLDAAMERTSRRPLPSQAVSPRAALGIAVVLTGAGLLVLAGGGMLAAALGLGAVAWYNGLYPVLKRATAFAAVPGALVGAVPPAIGWVLAGGNGPRAALWILCLFFFLWQVPHFWLIALEHGGDYRRAGLPIVTDLVPALRVRRLIAQWMLAAAACSLLLVPAGAAGTFASRAGLAAAAAWLGFLALRFVLRGHGDPARLFARMNIYVLVVIALLCLGRIPGG